MKKILLIITLFLININLVNAISVSDEVIYVDTTTLKEVEITEDIPTETNKITFMLSCNLYSVNYEFSSEYDFKKNGNTYTITFEEPVKGKIKLGLLNVNSTSDYKRTGNINIWNASYYNLNLKRSKTLQGTNIKTIIDSEKAKYENLKTSPYLVDIQSNIININIKKNVYEYDVLVDKDVEMLDLKPVLEYANATYEMTTQVINKMDQNKIVITVKDAKDNVQDYTLNIKISKEIKIDKSKFEVNYDYKEKLKLIAYFGIGVIFISLVIIDVKKRKKHKRRKR